MTMPSGTDRLGETVDHVRLRDGRQIHFRITGPEGGLVLVSHRGSPSAAGPKAWLENAAHARGLRVLQVTRPGYGTSGRRPGGRVVDDVDDTAQVLDALEIGECLVEGGSGGGPRALACAARLDGVMAVLVSRSVGPFDAADLDVMAGMGELNVLNLQAAMKDEALLRERLEAQRDQMLNDASVDNVIATLTSILPETDRRALTPAFAAELVDASGRAIGESVDGWVDDNIAVTRPWGFDVAEIDVPVFVWHGVEDRMAPIAHSRWIVNHVPTARPRFIDGAGHLSLLDNVETMLDELLAEVDTGRG